MINTSKLLNAIRDRVQVWQFQDIYSTSIKAKQAAAKLFVRETGVVVKETKEGSYIVMYWHPQRETTNEY